MGNIGFRVFTRVERPAVKLVEKYKRFAVANIGDAMGRFQVMDYGIKTINKPDVHMAGPAITIRVRPGDNLMVHKALDMARPGDVLVVDAQGSTLNGLWGEIMTKMAMKKDIAGLVIDGGVRDAKEINQLGFPVFTRAVISAGGDKDGPGEINIPINCGGVPVKPGDLVVGNYDGVIVIPGKEAAEVAEKTENIEKEEARIFAAIEDGTIDRSWVDENLKKKGCELIE